MSKQKSKENEAKEEPQLPLDIHYDKLIDWLISRQKLKKEWQTSLKDIKKKIQVGFKELPEQLQKTIDIQNVTYWGVESLLSAMEKAQTEAGTSTRTFFGGYADKNCRMLAEIIQLYKANGVYLAESARIMTQHTNFDIPALRKQIELGDKQAKELSRRAFETTKNAGTYRQQFLTQCANLDVKMTGADIEPGYNVEEVLSRAREGVVDSAVAIPRLLDRIITAANGSTVVEAVSYHTAFVTFTLNTSLTPQEVSKTTSECLATLRALQSGDSDLTSEAKRHLLLNDLSELEAFLVTREADLKEGGGASLFLQAPAVVQKQSDDLIKTYLAAVREVFTCAKNPRLHQLLLISTSEKYVDRVVNSLRQTITTAEKLDKNALNYSTRSNEMEENLVQHKQSLAKYVRLTKDVKAKCEAAISSMFEGRKVNIFGEITTI